MVEQPDLARHRLAEAPDDVLVGEEVGALHAVPGVQRDAVALVLAEDGGRAAFRAHRVRAHQLDLRHDADVDVAFRPVREFDGRA